MRKEYECFEKGPQNLIVPCKSRHANGTKLPSAGKDWLPIGRNAMIYGEKMAGS
jgi:hypothetical protein